MVEDKEVFILGHRITPDVMREVIEKASAVRWGTHLLRWRYFDMNHEGITYHRDALIPSGLWHLLKRVYVDQDWPVGTSFEKLNDDARVTIKHPETQIYLYGYYRTDPPRLQFGFLNCKTGIAVIYDMEADLIATVFRPEEGEDFFLHQIGTLRINRKEWGI